MFFRKETGDTAPPPPHWLQMACHPISHPMGLQCFPSKPLNPPLKRSSFS